MKHPKSGFTLIELLVVIAIIGILASLLLPTMGRALSKGKNIESINNLRQWGGAFEMYTSDNDGCYSDGLGVGWARGEWVTELRELYVVNKKILVSPFASTRGSQVYGGAKSAYQLGDSSPYKNDAASYGCNNWIYNASQDIQGRPMDDHWMGPTFADSDLGNIPVFGDSMWRGGGPRHTDLPPSHSNEWVGYGQGMKHFCIDRFDQKVNWLFMDGSVRSVHLPDLWKLKWHRSFDLNAGPNKWPEWMSK